MNIGQRTGFVTIALAICLASPAFAATRTPNGYPLPDTGCTPGAIDPAVALRVLQSRTFRTGRERSAAAGAARKNTTFTAYAIHHPLHTAEKSQTCELDPLVSPELGEAGMLGKIGLQCEPASASYFKMRDRVEDYFAARVAAGAIPLQVAQSGIAPDWKQYIRASEAYWKTHAMRGFESDR